MKPRNSSVAAIGRYLAVCLLALAAAGLIAVGETADSAPGPVTVPGNNYIAP